MCAASLLAWRETIESLALMPGPGRARLERPWGPVPLGESNAGPAGIVAGGEHAAALAAGPSPEEDLRDAPARRPLLAPALAPPPAPLSAPAGRAPSFASAPARASVPSRAGKAASARARGAGGPALRAPPRDAPRVLGRSAAPASEPPPAPRRGAPPPPDPAEAGPGRGAGEARPRPPVASAAAAPASSPGRGARPGPRKSFELFRPSPAARARSLRERDAHPPRVRPPTLDRALGPFALRPPGGTVPRPALDELSPRQPLAKPDGKPARWTEATLPWLERVDPQSAELVCPRKDGHWHAEPGATLYHAGTGRGLPSGEEWLWLARFERRWWALPDAAAEPWLRHRGRWWSRRDGVWFLLHAGEPWAWRHFSQWEADGLIHPASGTVVVYSEDLARAAVITPGEGAVLFHALSGEELARWTQDELPPRWRPAPESLTLPRGI